MKLFWEWFSLTIILCNPIFFYYLAITGPEWYSSNGWCQPVGDPNARFTHVPSFILSLVFTMTGLASKFGDEKDNEKQ